MRRSLKIILIILGAFVLLTIIANVIVVSSVRVVEEPQNRRSSIQMMGAHLEFETKPELSASETAILLKGKFGEARITPEEIFLNDKPIHPTNTHKIVFIQDDGSYTIQD